MMKKTVLLLPALLLLSACIKDLRDAPGPSVNVKSKTGVSTDPDTVANKVAFRLRLMKDSTDYDETMIAFKPGASPDYLAGEDGLFFQGFGPVNLASISADHTNLSINTLPYHQNMSIGLDVIAKDSGVLSLDISYQSNLPPTTQIWLKDMYLKDSLNLTSKKYSFTVNKADTGSFGSKRFCIVMKEGSVKHNTGGPN
jgi:hypothetical protein